MIEQQKAFREAAAAYCMAVREHEANVSDLSVHDLTESMRHRDLLWVAMMENYDRYVLSLGVS